MSTLPTLALEDLAAGMIAYVSPDLTTLTVPAARQTYAPQIRVHLAVYTDGAVWGYFPDDVAAETGEACRMILAPMANRFPATCA